LRRGRETIFLDTTYLLAFFGLNLVIRGASELDRVLALYDELHLSEVSVIEAKAKLLRLAIKDQGYEATVEGFGEKLDLLRENERVIFHEYRGVDDRRFNIVRRLKPKLDLFDQMILAQSVSVGSLLTEDEALLALRKSPEFHSCQEFRDLEIRRLGELLKEIG
jgi:hypothetical protein